MRPPHDGKQVGPGRGKPGKETERHQVRKSDEDLVSEFHQGQQASPPAMTGRI